MNRYFFNRAAAPVAVKTNPLHRPAQRFRIETEAVLRDIAYVLRLTRRVKEELCASRGLRNRPCNEKKDLT